MFDLGMMELLVIGVVALIVVGPKDLPVMFREVGRFMGRMRAMARDFQRAMNEAADDTGMKDLDRDIRKMTSARKLGLDHVSDAARSMADWNMEPKPGGAARGAETARMAEERAEAARRIREAAADRAADRAAERRGDGPGEGSEPRAEPGPAPGPMAEPRPEAAGAKAP